MSEMSAGRVDASIPLTARVRDFALRYGFNIILLAVFVFFALTAPRFLDLTNLISLLHAAAPMMVIASGLAVVVMTGKLDIRSARVAFLTASSVPCSSCARTSTRCWPWRSCSWSAC